MLAFHLFDGHKYQFQFMDAIAEVVDNSSNIGKDLALTVVLSAFYKVLYKMKVSLKQFGKLPIDIKREYLVEIVKEMISEIRELEQNYVISAIMEHEIYIKSICEYEKYLKLHNSAETNFL